MSDDDWDLEVPPGPKAIEKKSDQSSEDEDWDLEVPPNKASSEDDWDSEVLVHQETGRKESSVDHPRSPIGSSPQNLNFGVNDIRAQIRTEISEMEKWLDAMNQHIHSTDQKYGTLGMLCKDIDAKKRQVEELEFETKKTLKDIELLQAAIASTEYDLANQNLEIKRLSQHPTRSSSLWHSMKWLDIVGFIFLVFVIVVVLGLSLMKFSMHTLDREAAHWQKNLIKPS